MKMSEKNNANQDFAGGSEVVSPFRAITNLTINGAYILIPALPFYHYSLKALKPPPISSPKQLKNLEDHIKKKRLELGLLQRQVAQQIGVTTNTVYLWETNRKGPSLAHIPQIIHFLGYSPFPTWGHSLSKRVRAIRRFFGFSQEQMAAICSVMVIT